MGDSDVVGKLTKGATTWTYRSGDDTVDTFNASGRLVTRVLPDGRALSFAYDTGGRLVSVTDNFNRALQFAYDGRGLLVEVTDPAGQKIAYAYDANKTLTSATYPDTGVRSYNYTSLTVTGGVEPALLTGITDEEANLYASWTYDATAQPVSSEHAGGVDRNTLVYQKDANGKISGASVTNPLSGVTNYGFQYILGAGRLTSVSHALLPAVTRNLTYDAQGNVTTETDFNGNLTTYTYDLSRNLETQRVEASGTADARTVTTEWHATFRLPSRIAEPLKLTTFTYDAQGRVLTRTEHATTDADGSGGFGAPLAGSPRVWSWTYNAYGQVLTADGPRTDVSDVTSYAYYDVSDTDPGKRGNLAAVTNALGHVTRISAYDAHGRPLTIVAPNGLTTQLSYDARGRLTGKNVGGEQTAYTYDAAGQLTRVALPDGSTLDYTYDAAHRLTAITDPQGNAIHYTLDAAGNRIREEIRDPSNAVVQLKHRVYDALSRLAEELGAQNQSLAQYGYDAQGNRVSLTTPSDAGVRTTTQAFDGLNRLIRIVDPNAGQIQYGYDGQHRLSQVTDPRNLVTAYTLDGLGNQTRLVSPDTGTTTRAFDEAGNEVARTDARGQTTATTHDALGRPTSVQWHDGSRDHYVWDAGPNAVGRLSRIEQYDAANQLALSIDYGYDAHGRRTTETRTLDGVSHTTRYHYSAGRLVGLTYPSGKRIDYALDALGRVSEVRLTDLDGQVTTIATAIAYHPFGGVERLTNGAGEVLVWGQDQDGRPANYRLGGQTWQIGYDTGSRIAWQTNLGDATQTASYGYDALDRLTQAVLPTVTHGYGYDATGNRTSQTTGGAVRSYTTDPASNRLASIAGADPRRYSYDATGSLTADGAGLALGYDARGRLVSATAAGQSTGYRLDPLGQRIRKTGADDTLYHYDLEGRLIAESAPDGSVRREYLWLGHQPLAVIQ
ncbi:RHS repeat protein [Pseudothauera rhizosphaerae]|uniref:RHS repeat protein n=1 Tax=Pseudothauera rhizosphaerae TaxID=2565932 RepID=UPI001454BD71|nr:RHS repeat protein [Pseudothauera rhizosphaerae]